MNVLAWLDSLHTTDADGALTNRKWPEAQEAHAVLTELIDAGNSLLDAYKPVSDTFDIIPPQAVAQRKVRLRAALASAEAAR